ncbi:MAG: hypothetical protein ACP5MB_08850 [bacterium]
MDTPVDENIKKKKRLSIDKSQLSAALIAFSILLIITPFGLGRVITNPSMFIGAISAVNIFYGLVFLAGGIAVYFVSTGEEEQ